MRRKSVELREILDKFVKSNFCRYRRPKGSRIGNNPFWSLLLVTIDSNFQYRIFSTKVCVVAELDKLID